LADRYILSKLASTAQEATRHMERFDFGEASRVLYDYLWNEYCDWYIEMTKASLQAGGLRKILTLQVLSFALSRTLELMHPIMPFITEEIWQALPHKNESITLAPWPEPLSSLADTAAESQCSAVMDIIRGIRNIRAEMNVGPSKRTEIVIVAHNQEWRQIYEGGAEYIRALAHGKTVIFVDINPFEKGKAISLLVAGADVFLPLDEMVDIVAEIERLDKERHTLQGEVDRATKKLSTPSFVAKAPPAVIETEREKLADYEARLGAVEKRLKEIK
ncbi:MAG: class I tRNA ligase family protein, partial [bacterium]|nr:class I tRNA ligase family protein [bacterium]